MSVVTKLASEARVISRKIFASLPFEVRVRHIVAQIIKFAYAEEFPSLGVLTLRAIYKAGIKGPVGRSGVLIEDMGPLLKANSSKVLKPSLELAKRIFGASGVKSYDATEIEAGIWKLQERLSEDNAGLQASYTVNQAVSYLAKALRGYVNDAHRKDTRREEIQNLEIPFEEVMGNPRGFSRLSPEILENFMRKVQRNPAYKQNPDRKNYMYPFLVAVAEGGSSPGKDIEHGIISDIARELGISHVALRADLAKNKQELQKDFESVLKYMS